MKQSKTVIQPDKLPVIFKMKLIAALRSGLYRRGAGQLYNDEEDTYCPLGVACRVAGYGTKHLRGAIYPPNHLVKVPAILRDEASYLPTVAFQIADKNDHGWSLKRMAAWIEINL